VAFSVVRDLRALQLQPLQLQTRFAELLLLFLLGFRSFRKHAGLALVSPTNPTIVQGHMLPEMVCPFRAPHKISFYEFERRLATFRLAYLLHGILQIASRIPRH